MVHSLLYLPLHLTQSALGQKVEAKPVGASPWERCQGWAVMSSRDEAGLASWMGLRLGWSRGRVSLLQTKSGPPAPVGGSRAAVYAVSGVPMALVQHAVTSDKRSNHLTDEVPQRLGLTLQVNTGYKFGAKGGCDALATGTGSPWPRPWGWQRCRSSSAGRNERQNRNQLVNRWRLIGQVSRMAAATKWPGGTSSRQPVRSLRNGPHAAGRQTGKTSD